jgi:hypothetical protein
VFNVINRKLYRPKQCSDFATATFLISDSTDRFYPSTHNDSQRKVPARSQSVTSMREFLDGGKFGALVSGDVCGSKTMKTGMEPKEIIVRASVRRQTAGEKRAFNPVSPLSGSEPLERLPKRAASSRLLPAARSNRSLHARSRGTRLHSTRVDRAAGLGNLYLVACPLVAVVSPVGVRRVLNSVGIGLLDRHLAVNNLALLPEDGYKCF